MKINFKKPKYIIPAILLPFIILFYYIFSSWGGKSGKPETVDSTFVKAGQQQINPNMPGVSKEISTQNIKDKFEAYQEAYKYNKDNTALDNIDYVHAGNNPLPSAYSPEDIRRIRAQKTLDSLNRVLKNGQADMDSQMNTITKNANPFKPARKNNFSISSRDNKNIDQAQLEQLRSGFKYNDQSHEEPDSYNNQMKLFRDQMKVMDSLQKSYVNPESSNSPSIASKDALASGKQKNSKSVGTSTEGKFDPAKDTSFKPLPVKLSTAEKSRFITVSSAAPNQNIMAIIDQDIKATIGTRVRLRLIREIFVGDYLIPKGAYIYGVVTGFQTQRINISISQIISDNVPLSVKLDVFDNDGYLGLYVPGSNFREFTKEIGTQGTSGISQIQSNDNSNVITGLLKQVFSTTTTTAAQLIKKDKAFLKYNYIIYLKEKK